MAELLETLPNIMQATAAQWARRSGARTVGHPFTGGLAAQAAGSVSIVHHRLTGLRLRNESAPRSIGLTALQKTHPSHARLAMATPVVASYVRSVARSENMIRINRAGDLVMGKSDTYGEGAAAASEAIAERQTPGILSSVIEAIRARSARRRTIDALSRLSPSQLRDIGLTDADIERFWGSQF
jgi:uncharacterized protein YjiS (DUF1127 family)